MTRSIAPLLAVLMLGASALTPAVAAADAAAAKKAPSSAASKKAEVKKAEAKKTRPAAAPEAHEPQALNEEQLAAAQRVYVGAADCEFKQSVEVKAVPELPGHFDVTHKQVTYRMVPEVTTTGAVRLEDKKRGVVWLQIPVKSMMMNQRAGQRMVDACLHGEQRATVAAAEQAKLAAAAAPAAPVPAAGVTSPATAGATSAAAPVTATATTAVMTATPAAAVLVPAATVDTATASPGATTVPAAGRAVASQ